MSDRPAVDGFYVLRRTHANDPWLRTGPVDTVAAAYALTDYLLRQGYETELWERREGRWVEC